jgi:hypothetical protein
MRPLSCPSCEIAVCLAATPSNLKVSSEDVRGDLMQDPRYQGAWLGVGTVIYCSKLNRINRVFILISASSFLEDYLEKISKLSMIGL